MSHSQDKPYELFALSLDGFGAIDAVHFRGLEHAPLKFGLRETRLDPGCSLLAGLTF